MIDDLRTVRKEKGLTLEDLAANLVGIRTATLHAIELGQQVPRARTRKRIESVVGPVDWRKTLSVGGRDHVMLHLIEFINEKGENGEYNPREKIKFAKQALTMIEETLNN